MASVNGGCYPDAATVTGVTITRQEKEEDEEVDKGPRFVGRKGEDKFRCWGYHPQNIIETPPPPDHFPRLCSFALCHAPLSTPLNKAEVAARRRDASEATLDALRVPPGGEQSRWVALAVEPRGMPCPRVELPREAIVSRAREREGGWVGVSQSSAIFNVQSKLRDVSVSLVFSSQTAPHAITYLEDLSRPALARVGQGHCLCDACCRE